MRGRIRYQKPSQYWHPWTSWPKKMEREEACKWLAEHLEEYLPKLEEARRYLREVVFETERAKEIRETACAEDARGVGCRRIKRVLDGLYDEQEKTRNDIGKYQTRCINIEQRMKYLKCEEIL